MTVEERRETNTQHRHKLLFTAGFLVTLVGMIILIVAAIHDSGGNISFGGVIIVGPLPIIFGAGPDMAWLILLSVGITAVTLLIWLIMRRDARRMKS